jgi:hypothetical protein
MSQRELKYDNAEERMLPYLKFRRSLEASKYGYATDVDMIEWRVIDDVMLPVGVLEFTTTHEESINKIQPYLMTILERYNKGMQGYAAKHVATCLGVHAYIVFFTKECDDFWIYRLTQPWRQGWVQVGRERYMEFIRTLRRRDGA